MIQLPTANPPLDLSIAGIFSELKDFARNEPVTAVLAVVTGGVLLKLLPNRWLVTTGTVLATALIRPAIMTLAVTKILDFCCEKTAAPLI